MTALEYRVPPDARRCTATGKDGERCRAYRARDGELCAGHAGLGVAASPEAARAAQQRGAETRSALRHEARVLAYTTPRERIDAEMTARVESGAVMRAIDRGLEAKDARVARDTAALVLDRLLGRPVALTETQLPGTQAYNELRRTLDALEPGERLAYLRESRMAAGIAAVANTHSHPDLDPARTLEVGEEGKKEDARDVHAHDARA